MTRTSSGSSSGAVLLGTRPTTGSASLRRQGPACTGTGRGASPTSTHRDGPLAGHTCNGMMLVMDAATLIRTTREGAGLSQDALAARAGTSQPAVSRYESGASSPSVETLDRLLAAMGSRLELVAEASTRRLDVRTPRMAKLRLNRDRIRRAAHRHGASNVRVFGSVARGEDRPESDVDLLIDLDVRIRGLFPIGALQDELSALLGERVDVVPQDALAPHVARNALAEAVPL